MISYVMCTMELELVLQLELLLKVMMESALQMVVLKDLELQLVLE